MLKIIFAGTPDFAANHLEAILSGSKHEIIAVFTQPDRPAGRGKKLTPSPVKQLALEHQIPVFQPSSLKNPEQHHLLKSLDADLMVVVAYGLILPEQVLTIPRWGCVNVHGSLLPRWRGAAPIQRAIESGDVETGITIMQMDTGLDTGDMLLKASCKIEPDDTSATLYEKLSALGCSLLLDALDAFAQGRIKAEPQEDSKSCYAPKLEKAQGNLDWRQPAEKLALKVRAFNPSPGCYSVIDGLRIKIWQASVVKEHPYEVSSHLPGSIINADKNGILVSCSQSALLLELLQLPGKKIMPVADILNSQSQLFKPGNQFHFEETD